jgi:hypothetical protein
MAFESLSPADQAQRYRKMAEQAFLVSACAPTPELRIAYLNLASSWHNLAESAEHDGFAETANAAAWKAS